MPLFENIRIYKSVTERATGDTGKNRLFLSPVKIFTSDFFEAFVKHFLLMKILKQIILNHIDKVLNKFSKFF